MAENEEKVKTTNYRKNKYRIYIGTYDKPLMTGDGSIFLGKGDGIQILTMDAEAGRVIYQGRNRETSNTSWINCAVDGKILYVVNELDEFEGKETGAVSSFSLEDNGEINVLQTISSEGRAPCHLGVSPDGHGMAVANYSSGNIVLYRLKGDGTFEHSQQIQLDGKGPNSIRQAGPHAHCVLFDRTGSHLLVTNLGNDTIRVYTYRKDVIQIDENSIFAYKGKPGSGPRSMDFSADGKYLYVTNELDGSISVLSYQETSGQLTCIQNVLVNEWKDESEKDAAGLAISPDGRNLYMTTRNINQLMGFHRDPKTGLLKHIQSIETAGANPRSLAISPNGRWLIVGNQDTDNITIYERDPVDGRLHITEKLQVDTPVCVQIL